MLVTLCFQMQKLTCSKLKIRSYPRLNEIKSLEDLNENNITMDRDYSYILKKRKISDNKYIITLYYNQGLFSILKFSVRSQIKDKDQAMSFVSNFLPFVVFQFEIFKNMPFEEQFFEILRQFSGDYTQNLPRILKKLNSVSWSSKMLKYFYANCG